MRAALLALLVLPASAYAQAPEPAPAPPPPAPAPAPAVTAADAPELSDDDLAAIAAGEAIEIFDERPDKPFDRDTEVRLTGEQLAARGATDLATALALLPDVTVREAGRGGFNLDIRGARKGSVSVLVDGVLVTDPYYGTFDVSTIPVTDIVQIRVSTTPKSPIDGPGGPGGVVEVLTRDAIGGTLVIARLTGDSLPTLGMTATARTALARHLALRLSASGLAGARDLELPMLDATIDEGRRATTGSTRLEYRRGDRRIAVDGFLDDRRYVMPPSDAGSFVQAIDRESSARASVKADDRYGALQVQGQGWVHWLRRRSRTYADAQMETQTAAENLRAWRTGGMLLATAPVRRDFRWAASAVLDHERAEVTSLAATAGDTTLINLALDGQYEQKRFRLDAAAGVALPFGVGADPWPEAKLAAKLRPAAHLELTATTGYKGRVPSLRERFEGAVRNPDLGPEHALHAEVRAVEQRDGLRVEVAPFYRHVTGTIRAMDGVLGNIGDVDFYGVDVQGKLALHERLEGGASYGYIDAQGDASDEPLDRLPHHRFDVWVAGKPLRRLTALARVKFVSSQLDQSATLEPHALVEATLTAELGRAYLAVLRVDDLVDTAPVIRSGYSAAGRVVSIVLQGTWQ